MPPNSSGKSLELNMTWLYVICLDYLAFAFLMDFGSKVQEIDIEKV